MEIVLAGLAIASAAYWSLIALATLRVIRGVPVLERLRPREPEQWPRVSVIIPACNEAATLEGALRSRLAEGYPNAEYVVVDDRSTDATGQIIDRLAAEDPLVRAVHVRELPAGWLGKVHAMHVALGHATGEWVLFSDADIHHEPGTLRRVIAHSEEQRLDHVCVFPTVWAGGFWRDMMMNALLRILATFSRAWKVPDPRSRVSIGGGVFNLVRRSTLARAGGLEPLRMEVVDDAALGQQVKWAGGRQAVLNARGFVKLWFYSSLRDVVAGMEKNAFAVMGQFRVAQMIISLGVLAVVELGAIAGLFAAGWPVYLALATLGIALGAQVAMMRWLDRPAFPTLFAPLAIPVVVFAALRSMVLTVRRDGISWRGTRYPLAELRRGRKLVLI